ncbi:hypothetical protein [Acinetobacter sp.]|jgi:hypothetical protein|uniref:hypothetical protein n=1 Tax=Acinetobacter sp. TaxID=472 RepID=UPI0035B3C749
MNIPKISSTALLFWSFIAVMLGSISTAVFSESAFHDNFAFSMMALALTGILISTALLMVDAVLAVCNP